MPDFHGAKLAYIVADKLLVYRRDEVAGIPFPGYWDLPGGGREGDESPERCVLRELYEEFALTLTAERLIYRRDYTTPGRSVLACFFAAKGNQSEVERIAFGDEGQYWKLMPVGEFLSHSSGIPVLQSRVRDYLSSPR